MRCVSSWLFWLVFYRFPRTNPVEKFPTHRKFQNSRGLAHVGQVAALLIAKLLDAVHVDIVDIQVVIQFSSENPIKQVQDFLAPNRISL